MKHVKEDIILPYKIKKADSFFLRLRGLMFRNHPLKDEGLWISPCNSIHMCFMNFPIDVVFLNKENQVVKLVSDLKPWKFITPVSGAHSVLELPIGSIDNLNLEVGQFIKYN